MSESSEEKARRARRLRWITLGETIGIAALVISGLGLWHEWGRGDEPKPATTTTVIEKREPIPLALRARADDDGKRLVIAPIEASHALQSLTLTVAGSEPVSVGSDGVLEADSLERVVKQSEGETKGRQSVPVRIETRYVEMGQDKTASGTYRLSYRWEGGGLFGGRSLRLTGLTRA
jgi:hypothetical protein